MAQIHCAWTVHRSFTEGRTSSMSNEIATLILQDASGEQDPKDANSIEEEAAAAHLTALRNTGRYGNSKHGIC